MKPLVKQHQLIATLTQQQLPVDTYGAVFVCWKYSRQTQEICNTNHSASQGTEAPSSFSHQLSYT